MDETRGTPFIGGSGEERKQHEGLGGDPPRGFNNPNLKVSVKFKNKVKSNLFEFIVTIEPETQDNDDEEAKADRGGDDESSQYKVKRYLYEFEELFNHLEGQNPKDENLRKFDYNQTFQGATGQAEDKIEHLERFLSMLTDAKNIDSATGKMYLVDQRVQDFLKITDPQIKSKLVMMSLSKNSAGPFSPFGMLDHQ